MAFTSKYGLFNDEELTEMFTINGKELNSDICLVGFIIDSRCCSVGIGFEIGESKFSFPTNITINQLEKINSISDINQTILLTKKLIKESVKNVHDELLGMTEY